MSIPPDLTSTNWIYVSLILSMIIAICPLIAGSKSIRKHFEYESECCKGQLMEKFIAIDGDSWLTLAKLFQLNTDIIRRKLKKDILTD